MKEITPEEKAVALVGRYRALVKPITVGEYGIKSKTELAKEYALICVEEIVVTLDLMELSERGKVVGGWGQDYWEKVKEEIQKL